MRAEKIKKSVLFDNWKFLSLSCSCGTGNGQTVKLFEERKLNSFSKNMNTSGGSAPVRMDQIITPQKFAF